jgi:hypothetical protein
MIRAQESKLGLGRRSAGRGAMADEIAGVVSRTDYSMRSKGRNASPLCLARFWRYSSNVCFQHVAWMPAVSITTLPNLRWSVISAGRRNYVNVVVIRELGQTRTSPLGAARPLPPSADIGPGGQSVGQAAQL